MAADDKSKLIVNAMYNGTIRMTALAVWMKIGGVQRDEILRRVRIAERVGEHIDPELIGLSEAIAEVALDQWDALTRRKP